MFIDIGVLALKLCEMLRWSAYHLLACESLHIYCASIINYIGRSISQPWFFTPSLSPSLSHVSSSCFNHHKYTHTYTSFDDFHPKCVILIASHKTCIIKCHNNQPTNQTIKQKKMNMNKGCLNNIKTTTKNTHKPCKVEYVT